MRIYYFSSRYYTSERRKLIVLDYKTRGYPVKEDTAEHYQNS